MKRRTKNEEPRTKNQERGTKPKLRLTLVRKAQQETEAAILPTKVRKAKELLDELPAGEGYSTYDLCDEIHCDPSRWRCHFSGHPILAPYKIKHQSANIWAHPDTITALANGEIDV